MSEDGYVFTEPAMRKVVATTRKVQAEPVDLTDRPTDTLLSTGQVVWVFVTGDLGGGGHYEGKIALPPTADITPGSHAAAADFGTAHTPAYGKLYVTNAPEVGTNTHALTALGIPTRPFLGVVLRRQTDHTTWVGIESYAFENGCT